MLRCDLHQPDFNPPSGSKEFYAECLHVLGKSGIDFLVSGTYAIGCYTGVTRPTKDVGASASNASISGHLAPRGSPQRATWLAALTVPAQATAPDERLPACRGHRLLRRALCRLGVREESPDER